MAIYILIICVILAKLSSTNTPQETAVVMTFLAMCILLGVNHIITNVPADMYNYKASELFWAEVQRQGKFTLYFYFVALKFRKSYNPLSRLPKNLRNIFNDKAANKAYFAKFNPHSDLCGGYIPKNELKSIAKLIGAKYHSLRKWIPVMVREGLLRTTKNGYVMLSMAKAAKKLGVSLRSLKIKGGNKNELKEKIAYKIIKRVGREENRHKSKRQDATVLSCKRLAERTGYRSATTGSRRERTLEKKMKIVVIRHDCVKHTLVDSDGNSTFIFKRDCNLLKIA